MRVFALHVVAQCSKILLKGIFKASHLDTIRNHMKQEHEDTGVDVRRKSKSWSCEVTTNNL